MGSQYQWVLILWPYVQNWYYGTMDVFDIVTPWSQLILWPLQRWYCGHLSLSLQCTQFNKLLKDDLALWSNLEQCFDLETSSKLSTIGGAIFVNLEMRSYHSHENSDALKLGLEVNEIVSCQFVTLYAVFLRQDRFSWNLQQHFWDTRGSFVGGGHHACSYASGWHYQCIACRHHQ